MAGGNRAALLRCGAAHDLLPTALGEYIEEESDA
jgi:hypothetical protein